MSILELKNYFNDTIYKFLGHLFGVVILKNKRMCGLPLNLIKGEVSDEHHPDRLLIEDCKKLIKDLNTNINHVLREGNKCADKLAKLKGEE